MPTGTNPLPGGPTQPGAGAYGQVPTVPNPAGTLADVLSGNIANLGQIYQLGGGLNQFTAQQAAVPFNLNLPDYQKMIKQSSANTGSLLKGQIPTDVRNLIAQNAAERGVQTGAIGSDNSNAALLRALGLTSLGLQQQGEQNLTGEIARTPTGKQFDPSTFLTDPNTQLMLQYLANMLKAAPTPGAGDRLNLAQLLKGLGAGGAAGGAGGIRGGGGGGSNVDWFGNPYDVSHGQEGIIVGGPGAWNTQPTTTSNITRSNQWGLGPGYGGNMTTGPGRYYDSSMGTPPDWVNQPTPGVYMGAGAGGGEPAPGDWSYPTGGGEPAPGDWTDTGGGTDGSGLFGGGLAGGLGGLFGGAGLGGLFGGDLYP